MSYTRDGQNIPLGSRGDTAWSGTGLGTLIAVLKGIFLQRASSGTITDRSGTITAGATAQNAAAAMAARRWLLIHNPGVVGKFDTAPGEEFWVNFGTVAVRSQPSIRVSAGQTLVFEGRFVPVGTVSVIATTTATPFVVKEG